MVVSSVRWISVTPVLYHNSTNFATVQKQGRLLEFLPVGTECYEGLVGKEGEQDKGNAVSP